MPLYFVEANFGKLGTAFVETDRLTNSRANVINNIMSGEWNVVRVLEVNEDEGTCRDVSEDLAREICDLVVDSADMPTGDAYEFCEDNLGCRHMADLEREVNESARSDFAEHNTHHRAISGAA